MSETSATIKLRINFPGVKRAIESHQRWIKYLASEQWYSDMKVAFARTRNKQEVLKNVRKIVLEEIYNLYQPHRYERTYDLYFSMKVDMLDGVLAGLDIYSDQDVAEAQQPNSAGLSYAAFFEEPDKFNSFIPYDSMRYRPFIDAIQEFMDKWSSPAAMKAWLDSARKKAPKFAAG